ncbi:MAG: hypothetical protein ACAH95_14570 [Fimbriimonas sp.]
MTLPLHLAAALILCSQGGSYQQSLAWADRLLSIAVPLPKEPPGHALPEALAAYEAVGAKFGDTKEVMVGKGRCAFHSGEYDEAKYWLKKASAEKEWRLAALYSDVKSKASLLVPFPRTVEQVVQAEPGGTHWVAFACVKNRGYVKDFADEFGYYAYASLALYHFKRSSEGSLSSIGKPILLSSEQEARTACVLSVDLSGKGESATVLYLEYMGADNWPNQVIVFRNEPDGLREIGDFFGKDAIQFLHFGNSRRLVLEVTPTWKVWWPD